MGLATIQVSEIPDEGMPVTCEIEPQEIGLTDAEARFQGAMTISADLERVDTTVSASGVIDGVGLLECVRCLNEFESELSVTFFAEYQEDATPKKPAAPVGRSAPPPPAEEPEEHADEIYRYLNGTLDLAEMLREQVILALPTHPLCDERCRGLCPVCGQNLNLRSCGCEEQRPESPFAALKQKFEKDQRHESRSQ